MPKLYILCGIPASGKTSWAIEFLKEHPDTRYISRDEIRFSIVNEDEDYFSHEAEVFAEFSGAVAQTLMDGFDVIADATHINQFSRNKLIAAIDNFITEYEIKYVVFYTGVEVCINRNHQREGRAQVPDATIRGMRRSFKVPTLQESNRATEVIEVGKPTDEFYYLIEPYRKDVEYERDISDE